MTTFQQLCNMQMRYNLDQVESGETPITDNSQVNVQEHSHKLPEQCIPVGKGATTPCV